MGFVCGRDIGANYIWYAQRPGDIRRSPRPSPVNLMNLVEIARSCVQPVRCRIHSIDSLQDGPPGPSFCRDAPEGPSIENRERSGLRRCSTLAGQIRAGVMRNCDSLHRRIQTWVIANMANRARITEALSSLLVRRNDDAFVIIEHPESRKFVQFAGSASEQLLLDLPSQTLSETEFYSAVQLFRKIGIAGDEHDVLDEPDGQVVGKQFSFNVVFRSVADATRTAKTSSQPSTGSPLTAISKSLKTDVHRTQRRSSIKRMHRSRKHAGIASFGKLPER